MLTSHADSPAATPKTAPTAMEVPTEPKLADVKSCMSSMTIFSISDDGKLITVTPGGNSGRKRRHGKQILQLSWPSANDTRRFLLSDSPPSRRYGAGHMYLSHARFINTSFCDIEIHEIFRNSELKGHAPVAPPLRVPLDWNPHKLEDKDKVLIEYFKYSASQALTTFTHEPTDLGEILLRVSLSTKTESAKAALSSLLAFSSVHRNGVQAQAGALKVSALKTLAAAAQRTDLTTTEAVQHVATGMLLYSFEVQRLCCTSNQWTWYLWGAKKVLGTTLADKVQDDDIARLRDWVYYSNTMARFTLRHWDHPSSEKLGAPPDSYIEDSNTTSSAETLRFLSELFESTHQNPTCHVDSDYRTFLKVLDWRIQHITVECPMTELYRLSALIYLDRISGPLLNKFERTQLYIDRAFSILARLNSCERQFPVFVLGCEARTDGHRAIILDLISRTECSPASRSFIYVKLLLHALWSQDDLGEGELEYCSKLNCTISRCTSPPSFV
ncbi:hypothetical protein HD806DRAFT_483348 [Xylariaceae sp. AK1471]|nr:hypothetical protein HD806DRAFT_483348 [Xylariaceae sp. AK1471]